MDVQANLDKAVAWTKRAVDESGAQLVVLPETLTTGFVPGIDKAELWDRVDAIPGRLTAPLQQVSQALGIYLVVGTYERGAERGVVYNSAALLGPNGDVLGVYRKTHLFPTEACGWSSPGHEPVVVHTPLASIGMTICFDGDFPELYRAEAIMGAEVIARPSALLRSYEIWELTNRARRLRQSRVHLGVQRSGPGRGRQLLLWAQHDRRSDRTHPGPGPRHGGDHLRRA